MNVPSGGATPRVQAPTARQAVSAAPETPSPPSPAEIARVSGADAPTALGPGTVAGAPEAAAEPGKEARALRRRGTMPSSPDDREGLYRGVLWAARAAQECGRMLTRLAGQLERLEGRLSAVEHQAVESPGPSRPAVYDSGEGNALAKEVASLRQAVTTATEQISRLAGEVSAAQQRGSEQSAKTEARLAEVESLASDVVALDYQMTELQRAHGTVERKVDDVGRAQVVSRQAVSAHPSVRATQRSVDQLHGELTTVRSALARLDARVHELSGLPTVMEEVAARQFERLASEMLSLPFDAEGFYREMDSIAERVTGREEAVSVIAERVDSMGETSVGLRQDVDRVIGTLAEMRDTEAHARTRGDRLERRLEGLESARAEVARLYQVLARVLGDSGAVDTLPELFKGRSADAPLAAKSGQAVDSLRAEADRLRRSIDVLAGSDSRDRREAP